LRAFRDADRRYAVKPNGKTAVKEKIFGMIRWFCMIWAEAQDEPTRAYRRHVRGLIVGWTLTAVATALIELFPNDGRMSMYDVLRTQGLPWQQHWLAAIQLAGPLLMAWHLNGLRLWGRARFIQR
jgi:hypothetical protein